MKRSWTEFSWVVVIDNSLPFWCVDVLMLMKNSLLQLEQISSLSISTRIWLLQRSCSLYRFTVTQIDSKSICAFRQLVFIMIIKTEKKQNRVKYYVVALEDIKFILNKIQPWFFTNDQKYLLICRKNAVRWLAAELEMTT